MSSPYVGLVAPAVVYWLGYWRIEPIATDPSPTALATGLTELCRTSSTVNTPGRLVSNGSGARCNDQDSPNT